MKLLLPLLILFSFKANAQSADFIYLKKKNKTLQTIYAGQHISITTVSGAYITAFINGVKNDTLFLQEFIVNRIPTTIGTYIIDTAGSFRYKFHYNQIRAIGKKQKRGFNAKGSGASLFGGGVLLTVASGVVYLFDRKKFSAPLLIASATLGALGYLWATSGSDAIVIGKKYKLVYMDMSNTKN